MKTKLPLYTPSLLEHSTLEAIFVKREPLLQDLLDNHQQSITSKSKHFSLFIGPRGIGKTHLLSLFNYRVQKDPALAQNTVTAWLREEEWGIASYLDLLLQILTSLHANTDQLYLHDEDQAVNKAQNQLLEILGDKTLLLISENMDLIFQGLGTDGQHQLRSFIQNSGKITIVAAAQSLFTGVTLRKSPFYGFFRIEHLQPLDIDEATALLINIAKFDHKDDLVEMLQSSKGRVRVRALHHLANGNPRIYVTFSQLISADAFDQFTDAVLQMLDELTPYYQAKMIQIPPQQRKIVQFLCRQTGTTVVSDIAKFTHLKHQAASSQLKNLKDAGYVKSIAVGRTSHYEIAEPLMRLVLEVKEARATPVKLLINFIRHWFSALELKNLMALEQCNIFGKPWLGREFIQQAIELNEAQNFNPQLTSCVKDYIKTLQQGSSGQLQLIVEDLAEIGHQPKDIANLNPEQLRTALEQRLLAIADSLTTEKTLLEFKNLFQELAIFKRHHDNEAIDITIMAVLGLTFKQAKTSLSYDDYCELRKHFVWPTTTSQNVTKELITNVTLAILIRYNQSKINYCVDLLADLVKTCQSTNDQMLWLASSKTPYILIMSASASVNSLKTIKSIIDTQFHAIFSITNSHPSKASKTALIKNQTAKLQIEGEKSLLRAQQVFENIKKLGNESQLFSPLLTAATIYAGLHSRNNSREFSLIDVINLSNHPDYVNALVKGTELIGRILLATQENLESTGLTLLWSKLSTTAQKTHMTYQVIIIFAGFKHLKTNTFSRSIATLAETLDPSDQAILKPAQTFISAIEHYNNNDKDQTYLLKLPQEQRSLIAELLADDELTTNQNEQL